MKYIYIVIILYIASIYNIYAQCPNMDFESGDFTGWQGYTGAYPGNNIPEIGSMTAGIISGRQTISSGTGQDPYSLLPVTAPNSNYSTRLGDSNTGYQCERIRYSIPISQTNALITYQYAVVFEVPSAHANNEMPRFEVCLRDASENIIPVTLYSVYAGNNIPNYFTGSNGTVCSPWTTVAFDMSAYIGQTLTLDFGTADCALGAHFGYAYIDAKCGEPVIDTTYNGNNTMRLAAPEGFAAYNWSGGALSSTNDTAFVPLPTVATTYYCNVTTITGLTTQLSIPLVPPTVDAQFETHTTCNNTVVFNNTSSASIGSITTAQWNFGDNTTSTELNPIHIYNSVGQYTVTLIAGNNIGITDTVTTTITVMPEHFNMASLSTNNTCVNQPILLSLPGTSISYTINYGGAFNTINAQPDTVEYSYTNAGSYTVVVIAENSTGCIDTVTIPVDVLDIPTPLFTYYINSTMVEFSNQTTNADSVFWDFGDGQYSTTNNPTHNYPYQYGNYNVVLHAFNGCGENTFYTYVHIIPEGIAEINTKKNTVITYNIEEQLLQLNYFADGITQIKLLDIAGRLVSENTLPTANGVQITNIPQPALNKGLYIIQLQTGANVYNQKIIIN